MNLAMLYGGLEIDKMVMQM